ncbi:MAG: hypothetical protein Q4B99_00255 [Clostridia bacterium]|nr:hypothetical protein [Clostridia bacterium]
MRKLIITRRKSPFGMLIPYYLIIGFEKATVDDSDKQYCIKNGETVTIDAEEVPAVIVVAAETSTGVVFSKPVAIDGGTDDLTGTIITEYNISKGSSYSLIME